jgi:hypothetical protein
MSKQCTCGRSLSYPYCDNTHAIKPRIIENINQKTFNYLQDENDNKVVQVSRFISKEMSEDFIKSFDETNSWENVGFINTNVLTNLILNDGLKDYWMKLEDAIKKTIEIIYNKKVKLQTIYVQKWNKDSEGVKHSDTHNLDGSTGNITYKVATTLFLHSDFSGGEIKFYNKDMTVEPKQGSIYIFNGGLNNHEILKVTDGIRYTIVSFWDYEDSIYTDEQLKEMELSQQFWANYIKENQ